MKTKTPNLTPTRSGTNLPEQEYFPPQVDTTKLELLVDYALKKPGFVAKIRSRPNLVTDMDAQDVLTHLQSKGYGPLTDAEKIFCLGWAEAAAQMMPLDDGIAAWLRAYVDKPGPGG